MCYPGWLDVILDYQQPETGGWRRQVTDLPTYKSASAHFQLRTWRSAPFLVEIDFGSEWTSSVTGHYIGVTEQPVVPLCCGGQSLQHCHGRQCRHLDPAPSQVAPPVSVIGVATSGRPAERAVRRRLRAADHAISRCREQVPVCRTCQQPAPGAEKYRFTHLSYQWTDSIWRSRVNPSVSGLRLRRMYG